MALTTDEIIAMAKEVGFQEGWLNLWATNFERFAALVAAKEREECAQVCESEWSNAAERMYGRECAAALRARKE